MNKHCIYKLKEGKSLKGLEYSWDIENIFVVVEVFVYNHSTNEPLLIGFERINPETLEYHRTLDTIGAMSVEDFSDTFELYMNQKEVREVCERLKGGLIWMS